MNPEHGTPGGIGRSGKGSVPGQGGGGRAGNRGATGHGSGRRVPGEDALEDLAVEVRLGRCGCVDREPLVRRGQRHGQYPPGRMRPESVNPAVAHSIRELLFLAPQDVVGEGALEGASENGLLHPERGAGFRIHPDFRRMGGHPERWVDGHGQIQELQIEEGDAGLDTPRRHRLVCAQAVVEVQVFDLPHGLLVKRLRVRCLVEVQVATKDLVGPLARQDHLHAHRPDPPREQEHGGGRSDRGHVVGLDVTDDIREGIESLFKSVREAVMRRSEMGRDPGCGGQIRRSFEADGKGVEPGPPRLTPVVIFHPEAGKARRTGGHDR